MKVLFGQNVPLNLRSFLVNHEVSSAAQLGWSELKHGELLRAAEDAGFDVFITGDRNLQYQQTVTGRRLAILVLTRTNWPQVRPYAEEIAEKVSRL